LAYRELAHDDGWLIINKMITSEVVFCECAPAFT
jgi:hypothetical protein